MASQEVPLVGFAYGSQTGNAESICKQMFADARQRSLCRPDSECLTLNQLYDKGMTTFPVLVIVVSTTGDGGPPDNARKFSRHVLKRGSVSAGAMEGVRFSVLCLGDQNYECFCGFGRDVDVKLGELGGLRFMERGEADDGVGLELVVEPWRQKLLADTLPQAMQCEGISYAHTTAGAVSTPMSPQTRSSTQRCYTTTVREGKLADFVHFQKTIYPEVVRGLRAHGVSSLALFVVPGSHQVLMTATLVADFDLLSLFAPGSAYLRDAKCAEWEQLGSAPFHTGWTQCKQFHSSDVEWNTALGFSA